MVMTEPTNHPGRPTTDQATNQPAVDHDLAQAVRSAGRWRTTFYVVVLLVALGGQVSGAVEALHMPLLVAIPAVGALELGGVVVLNNADVRRRLGERATGSRILSAAIAVGAVAFNWLAHHNHLLGGFLAGMSALGYLVWMMHTENQRRDRLRAQGNLPPTSPAYPLGQWLRHPWLTTRARHLALVNPKIGLYGSLAAATLAARDERRRGAITKILRRKIRAAADPVAAEMATTVFDLDQIAQRLADRADYDRLTDLVAVDLDPDRLLIQPVDRPDADRVPDRVDRATDQPAVDTRPTTAVDQRPTDQPEPVDSEPTNRPARPRKAATNRAAPRPTDRHGLYVVGGRSRVVENAAILREIYGADLPTVERQIRSRTSWSKERVEKAVAAYRAGADLESTADDDQGDEPTTATA